MQGQPLANLFLPGNEYQIAIVLRLPDEHASKVLRFVDHDAPAVLLHKPRCFVVSDKWVGNKLNFARLFKIQDSITLLYFLTGLIS